MNDELIVHATKGRTVPPKDVSHLREHRRIYGPWRPYDQSYYIVRRQNAPGDSSSTPPNRCWFVSLTLAGLVLRIDSY